MFKGCEKREGSILCERWLVDGKVKDEVSTSAGLLVGPGDKNLSSFTIGQLEHLREGLQVYIRFREKLAG